MQVPKECAIAASASVANYQNRKINYEVARDVANEVIDDVSDGLYSGDIGVLLNSLGFASVTIVSCDLSILDYTWSKLSTSKQVEMIDAMLRRRPELNEKLNLKALRKFLTMQDCKNTLVVDHDFGQYIRGALDEGKPLVISYNWTMKWRLPKHDDKDRNDPIKGSMTYHAVCARGYNDEGVLVVDSHTQFYKRKLRQYRQGFYTIPWEELLTTMGTGDVIIAEGYSKEFAHELV